MTKFIGLNKLKIEISGPLCCVLTILFIHIQCLGQSPGVKVNSKINHARIKLGDSILMEWDITGTKDIFISNLGAVGKNGAAYILPKKSDYIYLFFDDDGVIKADSIFIAVDGVGSLVTYPDKKEFQNSYKRVVSSDKGLSFNLDTLTTILQNLDFQVEEDYDRRKLTASLITNYKIDHELNMNVKNQRQRRLAYYITFNKLFDPSEFKDLLEIRFYALIQFQRRSERKWFNESEEKLYYKTIDKLVENFQSK